MATLRNVDLSARQQLNLDLFGQELLTRGWQPSGTMGALFEQGWAVPYQAEFSLRTPGTALIARYVCAAAETHDLISLTLHARLDNQMVALNAENLDREVFGAFIRCAETLPVQDVRTVLETFSERRFNVTINIGDRYHPLDAASLRKLYSS
ncbi:hypothetical protein [Deinococcus altitudinis]|uniref:hypothetical protein n=1 Tax=Deinococcus altitudinis TaxID=468914 RepID=UPI0038924268